MGKYFTDYYKNYYDKLNGSSISDKAKTNSDNSALVLSTIGRLQSQISSAVWEELGYTELVNVSVPALQNRASILNENISSVLVKACTLSMEGLLPILEKLDATDKKYEATLTEYSSLREPSPRYVSVYDEKTETYSNTNEETSEYKNYVSNKARLEQEIKNLETELPTIQAEADAKIEEIKALNGNVKDFELDSSGNIVEISGLTLTDDEQAFIAALEKSIEASAIEEGTDYDTRLTSLSQLYNDGNTIIYNGGKEYGYSRQILTSQGKLVTVFQQLWNEGLAIKGGDGRMNLHNSGCSYNALAAVLSAKYSDVTPESLVRIFNGQYLSAGKMKTLVEKNFPGVLVEYRNIYSSGATKKAKIIEEIKKGNMAVCTVGPGPDARYTQRGHWVSIVDYNAATDSFIIGDSMDQKNANAGPISADYFLAKYEKNTNIIYISDTSGYIGDESVRL